MNLPETVHASAVLVGEAGILIRGASGSGKSSLLLGLLEAGSANRLVADDRVILRVAGGRLLAAAPPGLAGLLEVRGQGIVRRDYVSPVVIRCVVDLLAPALCPRLPEAGAKVDIEGVILPWLRLPLATLDGTARVASFLRVSGR